MRKLLRGIVDFRERQLPQYAEKFRHLATGQAPDALFVSCSDSRVDPNLLASTDPGDLFVLRNVGNLIPPATAEGVSTGDLSEAGAIEFALLVLKVPDIVICGHSSCGAMKALLGAEAVAGPPGQRGALGRQPPRLRSARTAQRAGADGAPDDLPHRP
jgi:carbonic anhydrase